MDNANNESDEYAADNLAQRQEQCVEQIFDKVAADIADDICSRDVNKGDLKKLMRLYVQAGCIPLPNQVSDEYSNDEMSTILRFARAALSNDTMSDSAIDFGGDRMISLDIGKRGIIVDESGNWGYNEFDEVYFDLPESVNDLDQLHSLTIDECRGIPELSGLKCLRAMYFNIRSRFDDDIEQGDFVPSSLPSLKKLNIEDSQRGEDTGLPPNVASWLSNSELPALEEVEILVWGDSPMIVNQIFDVLVSNPSVPKIRKVEVDVSRCKFTQANEYLFADLFLDVFPQVCPNLESLTYLAEFRSIFPEVSRRLDTGRYHPSLAETLECNLNYLGLKYRGWDGEAFHRISKEDKKVMLKLLKRFRRLSRIPLSFCIPMDKGPLDEKFNFLLAMNYGVGRVLIPETSMRFHSPSETTSEMLTMEETIQRQQEKWQSIPSTLWPNILQRACKDSRTWSQAREFLGMSWEQDSEQLCRPVDYTAVYRLLRPNSTLLSPALEGVLDNPFKRKCEDDGASYFDTQDMIHKILARSDRLGVPNSTIHLMRYSRELKEAHDKGRDKRQKVDK